MVAKDLNDRAPEEIARQVELSRQAEISTRASVDAPQVTFSCFVAKAASDNFKTAGEAFQQEQQENRARMVAF